MPQLPAEPLGQAGTAVPRLADEFAAVPAEPPVLRHPRVGEHRRRRVAGGTGGTSTSPAPSLPREDRPLPGRVPRVPRRLPVPADTDPDPQVPLATLPPASPGTADIARAAPVAGTAGAPGADARRRTAGGHRRRRQAADVAVPVLDRSAAPRLGARRSRHRRRPSVVRIAC